MAIANNPDQNLAFSDNVVVKRNTGKGIIQENVPLSLLRSTINAPGFGANEVVVDMIIDFTSNNTKFINICTPPAGSIITYVGLYVTVTVVGGSTTVKLAIGANAGTTNSYGVAATLTAGTTISSCFSTVVAASTGIDLNGVVTAGTSLGDTALTAGKVHVVVIYKTPTILIG